MLVEEIWKKPLLRQLLLVAGTVFNVAGELTAHGFTAILLPQLREPDSGFTTNSITDSWIGSSVTLGVVFGVWTVPFILDRIGRKRCHLLTILPFIIGWPLIIFANNIYLIIAARLIQGIGSGIRVPVCSIVIGECTSPTYRGAFLASINVSISLGIFFPHLIGTFFSWRVTALVCSTLSLVSFLIIVMLPDSPTWLVKVGRMEEAYKTFQWYRGNSKEAILEFKDIVNSIKLDDDNEISLKETIRSLGFWRPFGIVVVAGIIYVGSGVYVIANYTLDILSEILSSEESSYSVMLSIDILRIVVTIFGCFITRKFNRRTVFHISAFVTFISLCSLSVYIYYSKTAKFRMDSILIMSLLFYIYGTGTGLQGISYILIGEIFPVKFRGIGSTIAVAIYALSGFLILFLAPYTFAVLGRDGTFLTYALVVIICWFILYFTLPETKDKSLANIEKDMNQNKNYNFKDFDVVVGTS